jgi:GxxExxY protein
MKFMEELIYGDLSYRLNGAFFDVYRYLGSGYKEKTYCKAIKEAFIKEKVFFKEQFKAPLFYHEKIIAHRYFDFLVEDKIIIEVKVGQVVNDRDFLQLKEYLKMSGLKLGIIVLFSKDGAKPYRVLNLF